MLGSAECLEVRQPWDSVWTTFCRKHELIGRSNAGFHDDSTRCNCNASAR